MSEQTSVPGDAGQGANGATPGETPAATPTPQDTPKSFFERFEDPESRGFVEVKGWKSEADLLHSYRNLEKLRGVPPERLIQLPENLEDTEAMKPIYAKLGLAPPEKAEDYGFISLEGAEPQVAERLQGIAHKHGVPVKMAQSVMADILAMEAEARTAAVAEIEQEAAIEMGRLKARVGADKWEGFLEEGRRAARRFGVTPEEMAAMETNVGAGRMLEIWNTIGKTMGEGSFVEGSARPNMGGMTAEGATAERAKLMADSAFMGRYLKGDRTAKEQMDRLNEIIALGRAGGR